MNASLTERIKAHARELGFDLVGVAPAAAGPHSAFRNRSRASPARWPTCSASR